ncbi:ABC transporter ATP-binding protein [Cocleimonas flava]|uniref:Iron complex transport system ATP-binding protein n=1 Tax=Cocleimonas flava TaxID=634765 RepID=A0A4V2P8S4_9GAMM|nr:MULTISPECIES: ABC transporter ATP-binding protein [Cocleimonas]MEB8432281.1 ABC transporter ATP-binding protein [Cocleimonas sp. KMM 6892]MEC4714633.1 ABC transporter ATP-binding protein [Cocleimonas sp. KMM 6895]MEC4744553.1 ABC transporter ATP-binding protein [Cocleimonas sp. KMM 6896]TCJ86855.1 iron complex transport system ATP-binding protein [Cocleimonas flava]
MNIATIEAKSLTVGYGDKNIVSDINLRFFHGQVYCLLGPNGCGKTTLFKTLMGLIPALQGNVLINGKALHTQARKIIAKNIAYVAQNHGVVFPYKVLEVVLMGRTAHLGLFSAPGKVDIESAKAALATVGLSDFSDTDFNRISGGQQQLVLIARALAQDAGMIVMDEPTASLDFGNQMLVLEQIQKLANQGLGIILSTHNPDHAFRVAQETVLMAKGKLIAQGSPDEILTGAQLSAIYDFPVQVEVLASGARVCVPSF